MPTIFGYVFVRFDADKFTCLKKINYKFDKTLNANVYNNNIAMP